MAASSDWVMRLWEGAGMIVCSIFPILLILTLALAMFLKTLRATLTGPAVWRRVVAVALTLLSIATFFSPWGAWAAIDRGTKKGKELCAYRGCLAAGTEARIYGGAFSLHYCPQHISHAPAEISISARSTPSQINTPRDLWVALPVCLLIILSLVGFWPAMMAAFIPVEIGEGPTLRLVCVWAGVSIIGMNLLAWLWCVYVVPMCSQGG